MVECMFYLAKHLLHNYLHKCCLHLPFSERHKESINISLCKSLSFYSQNGQNKSYLIFGYMIL